MGPKRGDTREGVEAVEASTGEEKWVSEEHSDAVIALAVCGDLVISASYDNTVRLFDTQTGTAVLTIENMNKCRFSALCWHAAHQARPLRNP